MKSLTCLCKTVPSKTMDEYNKLKRKLKTSTVQYGSIISASYFATQGAETGVSAVVGAATSFVYITLLEDHVDHIETSLFQKQFIPPIVAVTFEMLWNKAPFAFDFDYGSTFVGFLAYKFALSTVLYETVKEMMLSDSRTMYEKPEYKDIE